MSTAPSTLSGLVPKAINWSIALSILLILAGFFAILVPVISGLGITLLFGWLMILSGITHLVFAFKTHTTGGVIWEIIIGIIYLFTGFYLILHPVAALFALTLILACYLFFEAIIEFVQYFQIRPRHGAGWLLFDAVITLILAVMIWRSWPASSVWVIGTLVGISMLFSGFSRLMLSLAAKRVLKTVF
ncbi:MAG TPA: DUF308 domain-containing protein [Edaphobacter sp.]|jgi:uncharacterized membrane protein HdeD (DUF308 family)|nr:DUF308 domain-containing protein [Edaphobacter sp.]